MLRAVRAVIMLCIFLEATASFGAERIISLAPAVTEILYELGLEDKIAAVTTFCDQPSSARQKPKVGGMSNPSLEAVISLKPDIVVMTTDGNPREFEGRLKALGIKTYVMRARRMIELPAEIIAMGKALSAEEEASALAARIEAAIIRFGQSKSKSPLNVLFIIWPEPLITAGPGTAIDDALKMLGHKNISGEAKINYPKYSMEEALRARPDAIVIGRGHEDMRKLSKRTLERLGNTPAVKNGRVYFAGDGLYRLGPRIVEGLEELSNVLDGPAGATKR